MIYAFLPLVAAALYGFSYVIIERLSGQINLTTYYVTSTVIFLLFAAGHGAIKHETVSLSYLKENPTVLLMILAAAAAGSVAWLCTTYAIKNVSASYATFGEISYPLFTLLFTYLIFGARHIDLTTIMGGLLIMIGSFILIYGQSRVGQR